MLPFLCLAVCMAVAPNSSPPPSPRIKKKLILSLVRVIYNLLCACVCCPPALLSAKKCINSDLKKRNIVLELTHPEKICQYIFSTRKETQWKLFRLFISLRNNGFIFRITILRITYTKDGWFYNLSQNRKE